MKTLYIDVYFLINFTVDILALYFAAIFSKTPLGVKRLIISSVLGALSACIIVFQNEYKYIALPASIISLFIICEVASGRISLWRKVRFMFAFIIFEALAGGGAYYLWSVFDKYLYDNLSSAQGTAVNRKLLLFSLLVLLSIGVFKMIVSFFSNLECEGSVEVEITFFDKSIKTEAFVDSGNLAIDPMDMRPVLFLKRDLAEKIFPNNIINLTDPDALDRSIRKRIRLIPVSRCGQTHVLTALRVDSVKLVGKNTNSEICVTVAIDKEGGNYGGYSALMPSAAISNVK